jgi:hypothetical protein
VRGRLVLLAAAALAVPAVALAAAGGSGKTEFHIAMSGAAESPKGDPDGKGTAEITIAGSKVCWQFHLSGIAAPSAAHIHKGVAGVAGPIVVPLGAAYHAKGCTTSPSAAVASQIAKNPAGYYVNVHNAKYPAGALRGQLSTATPEGSPKPAPTPATPTTTAPSGGEDGSGGYGY